MSCTYPECDCGIQGCGRSAPKDWQAAERVREAAPDLLAALQDAVDQLTSTSAWDDEILLSTVEAARAAIAKAEGKA